jgi:hypothetical protein
LAEEGQLLWRLDRQDGRMASESVVGRDEGEGELGKDKRLALQSAMAGRWEN